MSPIFFIRWIRKKILTGNNFVFINCNEGLKEVREATNKAGWKYIVESSLQEKFVYILHDQQTAH